MILLQLQQKIKLDIIMSIEVTKMVENIKLEKLLQFKNEYLQKVYADVEKAYYSSDKRSRNEPYRNELLGRYLNHKSKNDNSYPEPYTVFHTYTSLKSYFDFIYILSLARENVNRSLKLRQTAVFSPKDMLLH